MIPTYIKSNSICQILREKERLLLIRLLKNVSNVGRRSLTKKPLRFSTCHLFLITILYIMQNKQKSIYNSLSGGRGQKNKIGSLKKAPCQKYKKKTNKSSHWLKLEMWRDFSRTPFSSLSHSSLFSPLQFCRNQSSLNKSITQISVSM